MSDDQRRPDEPRDPVEGEARPEEAEADGEVDERPRRRSRRATRPGTGSGASGTSTDDGDVGWGDAPAAGTAADAREEQHERWLNEQRPPHWE